METIPAPVDIENIHKQGVFFCPKVMQNFFPSTVAVGVEHDYLSCI